MGKIGEISVKYVKRGGVRKENQGRVVSSSDCHALWVKDGLEQSFQILGPSIKQLLDSKKTFIVSNILLEYQRRLTLGPRI